MRRRECLSRRGKALSLLDLRLDRFEDYDRIVDHIAPGDSGIESFIRTLTTPLRASRGRPSEFDDIDQDFPIVASAQNFVDFRFDEHGRNARNENLSRSHPKDNPP
jgi:hypothetical protein